MYSKWNTLILICLVLAFSLLIFGVSQSKKIDELSLSVYEYPEVSNTVKVEYKRDEYDLTLGRISANWFDPENQLLIQGAHMKNMIEELSELEIVSRHKIDDLAHFGLSSEEVIRVKLFNSQDDVIAGVLIGSSGDISETFFIKREDQEEAFLVRGDRSLFDMRVARVTNDPSEVR